MKYDVFVEVNISEFITVEADSKEEAEDIENFRTSQNRCFEKTREIILSRW